MTMQLHKSGNFKKFDEFITINKSGKGLRFSSKFCLKYNLYDCEYVQFYSFTENDFKFAMIFTKEQAEGSYKLNRCDGRKSHYNGLVVNAHSFIKDTPVLKHNSKLNSVSYELKFEREYNAYCFNILPSFEQKTTNVKNINQELKGIYQLRDCDGNIIYIGKGNIKDRVRSHIEKDWDITTIEYSEVNDPLLRSDSETVHLRNFEKKYSRKPLHNLIGGKEVSFLREISNA